MRLVNFIFAALLGAAPAFCQETPDKVRNISIEEFQTAMDSLDGEVVIDLRTPDELKEQGKIAGAIVIDFFGPDFEPALQRLDRKKTYLLYCASGGRSGETAELMASMGFRHIFNVEEGFNGWVKRKLPVERLKNR